MILSQSRAVRVLGAIALLSLAGGARVALAAAPGCVPGAQIECSCVGGTKSVQVCAPDGASFLPCQCAAVPATPAPAPAAGFAPAPAALGVLDVSSSAPAIISVDGAEVGRAPVHVADLPPGAHLVRARFDAGGESARKVRVQPSAPATLVMEPPASAARHGMHLAIAASGGAVGLENHLGAGIAPELDVNYGMSTHLDLRVGGRLILGQTDRGTIVAAGVPASARFNLGSTFSLGLGVFAGLRTSPAHQVQNYNSSTSTYSYSRPQEVGILAGPEAFPAILHLGAQRQLELALDFGWLFNVASTHNAYGIVHFGLNATYLFM
jgi:hypothetical protein